MTDRNTNTNTNTDTNTDIDPTSWSLFSDYLDDFETTNWCVSTIGGSGLKNLYRKYGGTPNVLPIACTSDGILKGIINAISSATQGIYTRANNKVHPYGLQQQHVAANVHLSNAKVQNTKVSNAVANNIQIEIPPDDITFQDIPNLALAKIVSYVLRNADTCEVEYKNDYIKAVALSYKGMYEIAKNEISELDATSFVTLFNFFLFQLVEISNGYSNGKSLGFHTSLEDRNTFYFGIRAGLDAKYLNTSANATPKTDDDIKMLAQLTSSGSGFTTLLKIHIDNQDISYSESGDDEDDHYRGHGFTNSGCTIHDIQNTTVTLNWWCGNVGAMKTYSSKIKFYSEKSSQTNVPYSFLDEISKYIHDTFNPKQIKLMKANLVDDIYDPWVLYRLTRDKTEESTNVLSEYSMYTSLHLQCLKVQKFIDNCNKILSPSGDITNNSRRNINEKIRQILRLPYLVPDYNNDLVLKPKDPTLILRKNPKYKLLEPSISRFQYNEILVSAFKKLCTDNDQLDVFKILSFLSVQSIENDKNVFKDVDKVIENVGAVILNITQQLVIYIKLAIQSIQTNYSKITLKTYIGKVNTLAIGPSVKALDKEITIENVNTLAEHIKEIVVKIEVIKKELTENVKIQLKPATGGSVKQHVTFMYKNKKYTRKLCHGSRGGAYVNLNGIRVNLKNLKML